MAYVAAGITENIKPWDGVSGALPPTSDVLFQIVGVEQGVSSKKQTPQLTLECEVASEGELKGRKAFHRLNIGPNMKDAAKGRLVNLLNAVGIRADQQGGFDDEWLKGRFFIADIVAEPYQSAPDPVTGQSVEKMGSRLVNERPYGQQAQVPAAHAPAQPQYGAPMQPQYAAPPPPAQQPQYGAPAPGGYPQQPQAPVGYPGPVVGPAAAPYAPPPAPAGAPVGPVSYPAPGGQRGAPPITPVG